ncbi:MAG: histidine kinase [Burkholderiaceae bacterium]
MSLRLKFNLLLTMILALVAGALVWQQIHATRHGVHEEIEVAGLVAARVLSRVNEVNQNAGSEAMLKFLDRLGRVPANEIALYDEQGKVLYTSPPSQYQLGRAAPAWFAAIVSPADKDKTFDLSNGQLVVRSNASRAALDGWDQFTLLLGIIGVGFLMLVILAYWTIGRAMAPFARIIDGLREVQAGNYQTRLPALRGAEANAVGQTFNAMVDSVADSLAAREAAARATAELARNRELTQEIQRRIEHDHNALARELHDELGQHVTAIKTLGVSISRRVKDEQSPISQAAGLIVDSADTVHAVVRDMLTRLRPVSLDRFGLADALGDLIADWRLKHPEMRFTLRIGPGLEDLPPSVATAAFRIAQESVTNAVRHARADLVELNLRSLDNMLVLQVQDNGQGPADGQLVPGFGLTGMTERSTAVGGQVEFGRSRLGGIQVRARLPLSESYTNEQQPDPLAIGDATNPLREQPIAGRS